ncbi:MAG: ATP-dependent sacrificial sulfur transferase LarE [Methanobrevibacter sp.]|jgi:uncharacterized protein|nr:ATP-dependent sacrificial sulfur transferase LarE [Methanobrevibacter sp.]
MNLNEKIKKAEEVIKGKKIAIAFSGGADSTLIGYLGKKVASDVLAITFNNEIMPTNFINNSKKIADLIGIKQKIISKNFLENDKFTENNDKRCFICRKIMYSEIKDLGKKEGFETIVDGTNISDLLEDRPGILVNYENNILSPLVEAGITKEEVEEYLAMNNIEYSKSTTCLGTRISKNEKITAKKINRTKYAEDLIKKITKSEAIRVRNIGDIGQIEVDNIEPLLNKSTLRLIESELKAINFKKVTLDIGNNNSKQKELAIYKPCKDEDNKIMFENELPYEINIPKTCENLKKLGKVKCSTKMGITMLELEDKNITIFKNGKIIARKVENKEDAQDILIKVLPLIRRKF